MLFRIGTEETHGWGTSDPVLLAWLEAKAVLASLPAEDPDVVVNRRRVIEAGHYQFDSRAWKV